MTARALAGMLQKVGLLPQYNFEQLPFAYAMYMKEDKEGLELSTQFMRASSINVRIKFVGVWCVVRSLDLYHPSYFSVQGGTPCTPSG